MFHLRTLPVRLVSASLRMFPHFVGRWRLVRYALHQTRVCGPLLGPATVRTHHGFRMALDLRDWSDQHVYATGDYEDYTTQTILRVLEPGDVAVDVGANVGFFSLLMAGKVGPTGRVFAFEPSPAVRARLRRNLELNGTRNVEIHEEAVAESEGEATFYCGDDANSGLGTLRGAIGGESFRVRTCPLPACLPATARVRLIKIDIEGAEFAALRGMGPLLDRDRPELILEVSDQFLKELRSSAAEMIDFLRVRGYRIYLIDWDGLVPLARWHPGLPTQFNALCTHRSQLPTSLVVKP